MNKRGRPSAYRPLLDQIQKSIAPSDWHPIRYEHKTRTVLSQLRTRYEGFDFRAVPDGWGTYTIEASWRGDGETAAGRDD